MSIPARLPKTNVSRLAVCVAAVSLVAAGILLSPWTPRTRAADLAAPQARGGEETVVVIPIRGLIDGGLYDSVKRRAAAAMTLQPSLIVFTIDTYGGLVDFAMEITDVIGAIDTPKTVAYVPVKAYSAGAMIAMAAREIVVSPTASIGDAAPIAETPEGPLMLGEKFQSPVRGIFRKYAERNGYPIALAEAMVTPDTDVLEVTFEDGTRRYLTTAGLDSLPEAEKSRITDKRVLVPKGHLLTMSAAEAKSYGFARFVVGDFRALLADYNLADAKVVTYEVDWSETLVRFLNHPTVSSIILLIGIVAIYLEFKTPGVTAPGIVAIICFATFFFSRYFSGMAQYWEILIFVAGLALVVEVFLIPGFGVAGFLGIGLMFAGLLLAFLPQHITNTPLDVSFVMWSLAYIVGTFIASFFIGLALAKYLPRAPVVGAFYLGKPDPATVPHAQGAGVTLGKDLVGKTGTAYSYLRPSGKAIIEGDFYDVTTEGDLVPQGSKILVIAQRSNNIIVKEAK